MSGIAAMLLGGSAFSAVTRIYTTGTSATETVPTGASNVVISIWGGGGSGGITSTGGSNSGSGGAGGGGGGYSQKSVSVAGIKTVSPLV